MTLNDYILRWQEVYDKNQSRPTTYVAHGYIFKNHILPGLGHIPLSELTVEQVGDFLEEMKRETFQKYDAFTVGEVFNMKEEELKAPFLRLTRIFEYVCYGEFQIDNLEYERLSREFEDFRDLLEQQEGGRKV